MLSTLESYQAHKLACRDLPLAAIHSDGSEIVAVPLNAAFKRGLFVVMNDEKNFHYYTPESVIGDSLLKK